MALLAVAAVSCSDGGDDDNIGELPGPTTGPYVSVAVDNHFHDIHPETGVAIAADRAFVIRNEGRNLHNFTVEGTNITEDIRPGKSLRFDPIGETFEPGTYSVFCKYHASSEMTGEFTVTE